MLCRTASCAALFRDSLERIWRRLPKALFDTYRPEKHYMRGPGPKHRAKFFGADGKYVGQK
jgi:hypothetical protein